MAGTLSIFITDPLTGKLIPGVTRPPTYVEGIDKLVQVVALLFLNNGDRSIFAPDRAGGMRSLIGSNIDPEDPSELFADVRIILNRVEQTIKEEQINTSRPPSERLLSLQLVDIVPNEQELAVEIRVGVVNEEQQYTPAAVVMR